MLKEEINLESVKICVNSENQVSASKKNVVKMTKKKNKKLQELEIKPGLLDSVIYDEDKMEDIFTGISQNIWIEMEKQSLNMTVLSELSTIDVAHLSRILNNKAHIGLPALIKIANVLNVSPTDLFPYDNNIRKTNGQRFDDITKGLDVASNNFLLGVCADFAKEVRRLNEEDK